VIDQEAVDAEVTRVRRIFVVALAGALVAAAVAFTIELTNHDNATEPVTTLLPVTFREPGFVERPVRRIATLERPATSRRGTLQLPGGAAPIYVVARCDRGQVRVTLGAVSTARLCRGTAVGVVVLSSVRRPAPLNATVSGAQRGRWAVGIYR
jgi:hypothetical protein